MTNSNTLKSTLDMVRGLKSCTGMKVNRNFDGFFADRIVQSFTQSTLLDSIEHLAKAVDAQIEFIGGERTAGFMAAAYAPDAPSALAWIRQHPRVIAMIAGLKSEDDYLDAVGSIHVDAAVLVTGSVPAPEYQIKLSVKLLAPLAHGSDTKAGNATLFRRRRVMTDTGSILSLPYYAGNAVRGQIRDLLADHLLSSLGLTPRRDKPPLAIWFFHALYSGGVLEEQSKSMNAINKELGKNSSLRTDGLRRLRDRLPVLAVLGAAIGNRIIPGRAQFGDLRPACLEWGTGTAVAAELMDWEFLTRREDYEGRTEEDSHTGMIANTECIKAGIRMIGGIDIDTHENALERSVLGVGLDLLALRGFLGAENRRGLGKMELVINPEIDSEPYQQWLVEHRADVLEYLAEIGALNAPG